MCWSDPGLRSHEDIPGETGHGGDWIPAGDPGEDLPLLGLLSAINSHPFLRGNLALKGGAALNLFVFDVPRLSVDIDLNYVGSEATEDMLRERPQLEEALQAVLALEDFTVGRMPEQHAVGKWSLRYAHASGGSARIEADVNYMYRVPLWPVVHMSSLRLGSWGTSDLPLADVHERVAGKLAALVRSPKG